MVASELYDICIVLASAPPTVEALHRMHEVLVLCCAQGTQQHGGNFGNLFSQVDFLCKQHGIAAADRVAIQTMRRHSNQTELPSADEWRYDLRALTLLISAVFKEDVPGPLVNALPQHGQPIGTERKGRKKHVRCIVRSWDEQHIKANTEEDEVIIDYGSTEGGRDFSYLQRILRENMQLNLLDCDVDAHDVLLPRIIVVEPDFLLDVSSIAACFTPYGHHPLLYTVNRLKPRANTQAILLGNFAGTALDDVINGRSKKGELGASLRRSFTEQALRFCTCKDFDAPRFKLNAAEQLKNIHEAVNILFPKEKEATTPLLEPSFVCEQLGLQGRVDLMTSDMKLLVEQKAGKNMKIERDSHDPHGLQQESHYVQLLLYYGILRYNFGRTDNTVDIRLLYSRYPAAQGLLTVNYYRTLFFEAIRLRNQIVATELLIAREGFGRIIPLLTPSIIYKDVKPDGYFNQYVLPQLQQLSMELAALNPLERAYYERMMTFVYSEQLYQKLGNSSTRLHHGGGAVSDLWLMPLTEKQATGNILADLMLQKLEKSEELGGYDLLTLQGTLDTLNFRRGDMVYLYAYGDMPDVRESILYKGTIEQLESDQLTIRLNDGQRNSNAFTSKKLKHWAVEHGSSDITHTSNIRSLHQLITAHPSRRALLLGQRMPQADTTLQLSQSYSTVYDDLLLRAKQAKDYFLLVGPPGTGKTSQALRFLVKEELQNPQPTSILLTAYTNRAVDEICGMLEGEQLDYLRLGNDSACDPRYSHRLLSTALAHIGKLSDMQQHIVETPIIVGTTSTLQTRQELFELKHFSLCIVDEASQILEPNIVGLLAHERIDRFILIGDYKQLPAVASSDAQVSEVTEPCLRAIGLTDCRQSLFERLIRWEQQQGRTQFIGTLNHQGRMHPTVAQFACEHFYQQEQLQAVPLPHQQETGAVYSIRTEQPIDNLLTQRRVIYIDTDKEATVTAQVLKRIYYYYGTAFDADKTVGVIVTYRNQISPIRKALEELHIEQLNHISIDTVERYQGSQRDVIVYAFGVDHRYQMDFLTANTFVENGKLIDRKLNVAMTRARRQLVMTGRKEVLNSSTLFRELTASYEVAWPNIEE